MKLRFLNPFWWRRLRRARAERERRSARRALRLSERLRAECYRDYLTAPYGREAIRLCRELGEWHDLIAHLKRIAA